MRQTLRLFKCEAWGRAHDGSSKRVLYDAELIASLNSYGAASTFTGRYGYDPVEWHEMRNDGTPPLIVIRVTEVDEFRKPLSNQRGE